MRKMNENKKIVEIETKKELYKIINRKTKRIANILPLSEEQKNRAQLLLNTVTNMTLTGLDSYELAERLERELLYAIEENNHEPRNIIHLYGKEGHCPFNLPHFPHQLNEHEYCRGKEGRIPILWYYIDLSIKIIEKQENEEIVQTYCHAFVNMEGENNE